VLKRAEAWAGKTSSDGKLYRKYTPTVPKGRQVELKFIPYYAWANRAATPMQVWTPTLRA
jgi:DUF1680 family protein